MKTENIKVKCLKSFSSGKFNEGNLYSVKKAEKVSSNTEYNIQLVIETNNLGESHFCWMPESMKNGSLSFAECFELVVEEDFTAKDDDISDAMQYSIQCGMEAGGPIFAAMKRGDCLVERYLSRCMLADLDKLISKPNPEEGADYGAGFEVGFGDVKIQPEKGSFKINRDGCISFFDAGGKLISFIGSLQDKENNTPPSERDDPVSSDEVMMELRNVLRCPDGANIVIWAEILAAGYFGEKHRKGGAVEDAIHYKKNGAYSDEALAKILAAIVNDGTNS